MAKHNFTLSALDIKGEVKYRLQECMMHIANHNSDFKVIIPHIWLNDNLTKESVYKWLEIGNKTLFPAKISEATIDSKYIKIGGSSCKLNGHYTGLKVEPRQLKTKDRYRSNDVLQMPLGTFKFSHVDIDFVKLKQKSLNINFNCTCERIQCLNERGKPVDINGHSGWGASIFDLQLADTKELLVDHIARTYSDFETLKPEYIPAYEVTIDCLRSTISNSHKLAILSFYRYLWSNRYQSLVENTLKLESLGVDTWLALYYSLSKPNYNNYYSLLENPGFKSIDKVKNSLSRHNSVNKAFSIDEFSKYLYTNFNLNDEELIAATEAFKIATPKGARILKDFICNTSTKTLTSGKLYRDCVVNNDRRTINAHGDDYKYRDYLIYRFNEVK